MRIETAELIALDDAIKRFPFLEQVASISGFQLTDTKDGRLYVLYVPMYDTFLAERPSNQDDNTATHTNTDKTCALYSVDLHEAVREIRMHFGRFVVNPARNMGLQYAPGPEPDFEDVFEEGESISDALDREASTPLKYVVLYERSQHNWGGETTHTVWIANASTQMSQKGSFDRNRHR